MRKILFIPISFVTVSCLQVEPCAVYQDKIKELSCNIVIVRQSDSGNNYWVNGYNPVNKKNSSYYYSSGQFILIRKVATIGDTLVKQRGESFYTVKKKGFNVILPNDCDGDDYVPAKQDTVTKCVSLK